MYSIKSKGLQFNYPYRLAFNLISQTNSNKDTNTVNNYERPIKGSRNKEKPNTYIVKLIKDREQTIKENQKKKVDLLIDKAYERYNNNIRTYNFNTIYKNERKVCDYLPKITKQRITEEIINKSNKLFPVHYYSVQKNTIGEALMRRKEREKKLNQYKPMYRIKYLTDTNDLNSPIIPYTEKEISTQVYSVDLSKTTSTLFSKLNKKNRRSKQNIHEITR